MKWEKIMEKPTFPQSAPHITRANWCSHPRTKPCWGSQPGQGRGVGAGRTLELSRLMGVCGLCTAPVGAWASTGLCPPRVPTGRCEAQGQEAHPWGTRAQGSWHNAAASSCPTAVPPVPVSSLGDTLPQHPQPMLNTAHQQKAFMMHSALLLLSKEPVTWCPTYTCLFFLQMWHWDLMNFLSSLHFPLLTSSLSAEPLPLLHTLHWLFHPSFVPCTCL